MQIILMYIAGAIALLLLGGGVAWKVTSDYDEVKFNKYKSEVEKAGYRQQESNWREKLARDEITQALERAHAATKINLDNQYAAARRLLNSKPRSGSVSTLPDTSASRSCGPEQTDIASTIHGLEGRILDILEQGDRAISAKVTLEDWLIEQSKINQVD